VELDHRSWALPAFSIAVVLTPLFALASLLVLPGLLVRMAVWGWNSARRRALPWIAGTTVGLATVGGAVYVGLYKPVTDANPGLASFWHDELLSSSNGDPLFIGRTLDTIRTNTIGVAFPDATGLKLTALTVALIAGFGVGAFVFTRRWRWFPFVLVSGWLTTLVAGALTDSPVTPVRVTLGFYWMVYVTIVFGCLRAISFVISRIIRADWPARVAFGGAVVLLIVGMWPPLIPVGGAFAQGLDHDLDVVAASPTRENLVLSYHFMSQSYPHDRLINRGPPGRHYVVVADRLDRRTLYTHVDQLVRRYLPRGGTLWCVVPDALGPADQDAACRLSPTYGRQVRRVRGATAVILEYRIS
jgi:hypothetical protein